MNTEGTPTPLSHETQDGGVYHHLHLHEGWQQERCTTTIMTGDRRRYATLFYLFSYPYWLPVVINMSDDVEGTPCHCSWSLTTPPSHETTTATTEGTYGRCSARYACRFCSFLYIYIYSSSWQNKLNLAENLYQAGAAAQNSPQDTPTSCNILIWVF